MKKILSILLLTLSVFSLAQFKVIGSSNEWRLIGKYYNELKLYKSENKAKFVYLDWNSIVGNNRNMYNPTSDYEFEFSAKQEDLDKLYDLIIEKYNARKEEEIALEFPEGNIYLSFFKAAFGSFTFVFKFDNKSSGMDKNSSGSKRQTYPFEIKQINKIFGKTK